MRASRLLKLLVAGVVLSAPVATFASDRFQGPFAGVYFGYADGQDDGVEHSIPSGVPNGFTQSASPTGGLLGAMAGYDMHFGSNYVFGVEADFEVRQGEDNITQLFNGTPTGFRVGTKLEDAGSVRLKLGYEFNGGKTLAYVTGGYAAANIERYYSTPLLKESSWQDGWTAGLGVEHFIGDKFSVKADLRYADYGKDVRYASAWNTNEHQKYDETSFRFGMMYRF